MTIKPKARLRSASPSQNNTSGAQSSVKNNSGIYGSGKSAVSVGQRIVQATTMVGLGVGPKHVP